MKNTKKSKALSKTSKNVPFEAFRRQIRSVVNRKGTVSSLNLARIQPLVTGQRRGALIRNAFVSLVNEGLIMATTDTVYNSGHRHSVRVYRRN